LFPGFLHHDFLFLKVGFSITKESKVICKLGKIINFISMKGIVLYTIPFVV